MSKILNKSSKSSKNKKIQNAMMKTAIVWSELSYCKRKQVGAVISKDSRIVSCGFNGTVSGSINVCENFETFESQLEKETFSGKKLICPTCNGLCTVQTYNSKNHEICKDCCGHGEVKSINTTNPNTIHAEANVILSCAKNGIPTLGAELYVTLAPCIECSKMIVQSGISKVYYNEEYGEEGIEFLKKCGVKIKKLSI